MNKTIYQHANPLHYHDFPNDLVFLYSFHELKGFSDILQVKIMKGLCSGNYFLFQTFIYYCMF